MNDSRHNELLCEPRLLLGTFKNRDSDSLQGVIRTCLENSINGFDTAPSYHTEQTLGCMLNDLFSARVARRDEVYVSTKIDAWQMQKFRGEVSACLESVLADMKMDYVDQLLIHWPVPNFFHETWACLERLKQEGKARYIGVCNVRVRHLNSLFGGLSTPDVIQNERHPLRTDEDVLDYCEKEAISYQAYSPVGQMMEAIRNTGVLEVLAKNYNCSIGQLIMAWHLQTGSSPVFMTTKHSRVLEYSAAREIELSDEVLGTISTLNQNYKIFLESVGCPGF